MLRRLIKGPEYQYNQYTKLRSVYGVLFYIEIPSASSFYHPQASFKRATPPLSIEMKLIELPTGLLFRHYSNFDIIYQPTRFLYQRPEALRTYDISIHLRMIALQVYCPADGSEASIIIGLLSNRRQGFTLFRRREASQTTQQSKQ